jgi:hypothetical protein
VAGTRSAAGRIVVGVSGTPASATVVRLAVACGRPACILSSPIHTMLLAVGQQAIQTLPLGASYQN